MNATCLEFRNDLRSSGFTGLNAFRLDEGCDVLPVDTTCLVTGFQVSYHFHSFDKDRMVFHAVPMESLSL
jgi:hypothetical protein